MEKSKTTDQIVHLLDSHGNQPHQFVGDFDGLKGLINKTERECRLETILKTLVKRIKEEKEDVGIMGSLVKIADEELSNV